MRRAALAAIERKLFIHNPNPQRLANRKLMGATNRLPEHPQVAPGQSSRSGVNEIVKIHRRRHNSLSRGGLSSERATEPPGSGVGPRYVSVTLCFDNSGIPPRILYFPPLAPHFRCLNRSRKLHS